MTRGELMARMTAREFDDWKRFASERPFGEIAADLRAAQIVTMLANINRDPKQRSVPFALSDFLLFHEKPAPTDEQIGDSVADALMALVDRGAG